MVVELSKVRLIEAAVLLHPSLVTVDDIKGMNPTFRICYFSVKESASGSNSQLSCSREYIINFVWYML